MNTTQTAYFLGEKVLEERVQIICWGNQVIHQGDQAEGEIFESKHLKGQLGLPLVTKKCV